MGEKDMSEKILEDYNDSAAGLRYINKVGLDAALASAVAKGYCDWKTIKVIA